MTTMNKLPLIIILALTLTRVYSQPVETITIKAPSPAKTKEIFQVLKSDPEIKNGYYKKYKFKKLIETGFYKNNQKDSVWNIYSKNGKIVATGTYQSGIISGIWSYYSIDGALYQKYNHDTDQLIFSEDSLPESTQDMEEQIPIFIGGLYYMNTLIENNTIYPKEAWLKSRKATVYISFVVDETGNTTDVISTRPVGDGFDEEGVRLVTQLGKSWIPGVQKGKKVKVKYNLPLKFSLK